MPVEVDSGCGLNHTLFSAEDEIDQRWLVFGNFSNNYEAESDIAVYHNLSRKGAFERIWDINSFRVFSITA